MTIAEDKLELFELLQTYVSGLRLEWVSVSQVKILPGTCISDDGQEPLVLLSDETVDLAASGAGGLDTGSEAASTWYYIWLIKRPEEAELTGNVRGLISASFSSPVLPSGFTWKKLLGAVRNNVASNLLNFESCGEGFQRTIYYLEDVDSTLQVLVNGNSTTWAPVSLANRVPPITRHAILQATVRAQDGWLRQTGTTPATTHLQAGTNLDLTMMADSNQSVDYYVLTIAGRFDLSVRGYCYRV